MGQPPRVPALEERIVRDAGYELARQVQALSAQANTLLHYGEMGKACYVFSGKKYEPKVKVLGRTSLGHSGGHAGSKPSVKPSKPGKDKDGGAGNGHP